MQRIKTPIFLILSFAAGYLSTIILPDYSWQALSSKLPAQATLGTEAQKPDAGSNEFVTMVNFDGLHFNPSYVTIKKSYMIAITNMSKDEKMWLQSDNPNLATTRAYAESERLKVELDTPGNFKVINKEKSGGVLNVKVIP
jgi:hypothetical protein